MVRRLVICQLSCNAMRTVFMAFVEDNATLSSIPYFENHVSYFCAKPKEVDPINLNFCMTNNCFDITQIYNQ